MPKLGEQFEKAVFEFAKTLDPSSEVIFNHSVPDRDTGTPRQCDVWINAKFGGHWPLSILVSCKDHEERLDIGDIGTFRSEVESTGASFGVIYSRAGFTRPALDKAKAHGIACCRLYEGQPADIPGSILFELFACSPLVRLWSPNEYGKTTYETWNDLFDIPEGGKTVLEIITDRYIEGEEKSIQEGNRLRSFPKDWINTLKFWGNQYEMELQIQVECRWKKYRARLEAHLLNGSYCVSDGSFVGDVIGPSLDMQGEHPGEGWTEISNPDFPLPENRIVMILYRGDIKDALRTYLGPQSLKKGSGE